MMPPPDPDFLRAQSEYRMAKVRSGESQDFLGAVILALVRFSAGKIGPIKSWLPHINIKSTIAPIIGMIKLALTESHDPRSPKS